MTTMATLHDLDAEIARRVMGDQPDRQVNGRWRLVGGKPVRPYTTDIAAAWQVVGVISMTWAFSLDQTIDMRWQCTLGGESFIEDTAPLAICKAALHFGDR
jgi:hypothetical protein